MTYMYSDRVNELVHLLNKWYGNQIIISNNVIIRLSIFWRMYDTNRWSSSKDLAHNPINRQDLYLIEKKNIVRQPCPTAFIHWLHLHIISISINTLLGVNYKSGRVHDMIVQAVYSNPDTCTSLNQTFNNNSTCLVQPIAHAYICRTIQHNIAKHTHTPILYKWVRILMSEGTRYIYILKWLVIE